MNIKRNVQSNGIFSFFKVFSALPEEMSVPDQRGAESKLDEVFWNICKSHYIERDKPIFPDDCVYKLFRIFSMLGEMVENDDGQIEVISKVYLGLPNSSWRFNIQLLSPQSSISLFSHVGGNGSWRG